MPRKRGSSRHEKRELSDGAVHQRAARVADTEDRVPPSPGAAGGTPSPASAQVCIACTCRPILWFNVVSLSTRLNFRVRPQRNAKGDAAKALHELSESVHKKTQLCSLRTHSTEFQGRWTSQKAKWTEFQGRWTSQKAKWTEFRAKRTSEKTKWTEFRAKRTSEKAKWTGFRGKRTSEKAKWTGFQAELGDSIASTCLPSSRSPPPPWRLCVRFRLSKCAVSR
jgi:hypothetical protein